MLVDFVIGCVVILVLIGAVLGLLNAVLAILLDILDIFNPKL